VDHRARQQKAGPAGGQRRGSRLPGSQAQTGVAPGLSGSGTPAATQITLFWRSVGGCGSEQVAAHIAAQAVHVRIEVAARNLLAAVGASR
jgi:hypothetical protein